MTNKKKAKPSIEPIDDPENVWWMFDSEGNLLDHYEDVYKVGEPQDFDEYAELWLNEQLSYEQLQEFDYRIIQYFVRCYHLNETPYPWVMRILAKRLDWILLGAPWFEVFNLPWDACSTDIPEPTRAQQKDDEIYNWIRQEKIDNPDSSITDIMQSAATKFHVSYEKVRAGYYLRRKGRNW